MGRGKASQPSGLGTLRMYGNIRVFYRSFGWHAPSPQCVVIMTFGMTISNNSPRNACWNPNDVSPTLPPTDVCQNSRLCGSLPNLNKWTSFKLQILGFLELCLSYSQWEQIIFDTSAFQPSRISPPGGGKQEKTRPQVRLQSQAT